VGKAIVKTLAALLAAAAALVIALQAQQLVTFPRQVLLTAVVTSAALAAVTTIAGAWSEWRNRRRGDQRALAETQLAASLWAIHDQLAHAIDFRELGLAVYRRERRWWWPFTVRLVRLYRVRSSLRPATANVTWKPGKGVAGACVERGVVVAVDLAQMYDDLGPLDENSWNALADDVKMGLSWREYLETLDKYAVVIAVPVIDDSRRQARIRGCVVLDGPRGSLAQLTEPEVIALLNALAQGLLRQVA